MAELAKAYDPSGFEARWYERWESQGAFRPQASRTGAKYVISMPPPNVTGSLHVGHLLNHTIQDVLTRSHRMRGDETLWVPGMDHAGIATQMVVRRELEKQGRDIVAMGREAFIAEVWAWKEQYGGKILKQLRRLGVSCDWDHERFTFDEGLSHAVEVCFEHLYRKGLIYRGEYLVNWCIDCQTAISDDEVEHEERHDQLYHVRYPIEGTSRVITIATTRPETILADVAIAVNPEDERYADLKGAHAVVPVVGRKIPIVFDAAVDKEFGTGALKVTPGHDPVDFEIGRRHELPIISMLDQHGILNAHAGEFAGQTREAARKSFVARLEADGLLEKTEPYTHSVGVCHRSGTVIEPFLSKQWFVRMKELARPAAEAARNGDVTFVPARWEKTYLHWMDNIRDWCISRQLWWGHSIPIAYCENGHDRLKSDSDKPCPKCGSTQATLDPDVLDTWFSSWLWPFSTLGWPEKTEDMKTYYPTHDLITGPDIIFFWVARMVMAGYEFVGQKPFSRVHLHGIVRDEQGRKMSKTLGNSPDPIDLIDKYGADAIRFTLLLLTPQGNDVLFGEKRIETGRNFANKLWNAARFALMQLEGTPADQLKAGTAGSTELSDRWLRTRIGEVASEVQRQTDEFRFNDAARSLYDFVWKEYCDWYLEMAKVRIAAGGPDALAARRGVLEGLQMILRMLHPMMPFITSEIWSSLPGSEGELIAAEWPDSAAFPPDEEARAVMATFVDTVTAVRNLRSVMNVQPAREAPVALRTPSGMETGLRALAPAFKMLTRASALEIGPDAVKPKQAAADVARGVEVFVDLEGLIDLDAERERLTKERERMAGLVLSARKKLENADFLAKARPEVVVKEREKLGLLEESLAKLEKAVAAVDV